MFPAIDRYERPPYARASDFNWRAEKGPIRLRTGVCWHQAPFFMVNSGTLIQTYVNINRSCDNFSTYEIKGTAPPPGA